MSERTSYVIALNGIDLIPVREVSQDEFDEINRIHSLLNYFYQDFDLLPILKSNFIEFEKTFVAIPKSFDPGNLTREKGLNNLFLVNRLAINFLNVFRLYLDHTETRLKRNYGKNSNLFKVFKKSTSQYYDNTLEYAFAYQLRNYVHHIAKPITSSGQAKFNRGETTPYQSSSNFFIDKEFLLSNYDEWKKVVLEKLENFPKEIEPVHLFMNTLKYVKKFDREVRTSVVSTLNLSGLEYQTCF